MFIHELEDFKSLIDIVSNELSIIPQIVEKDYWLTHVLWGLNKQALNFELKGGTSLSKGFNIIHRFSEDVDIKIYPPGTMDVKAGKNHVKPSHIKSRENYFQWLTENIKIPGVIEVIRDRNFDDDKSRNAGLRLTYLSSYSKIEGLKPGILLEVGFDTTIPNTPVNIASWLHDKVKTSGVTVVDNTAKNIKCYLPEYTFVEKLQTISTKYRQQQLQGSMPTNFIRHYYDIYQLLFYKPVLDFIGSEEYNDHKIKRFRKNDETEIKLNEAFILADKKVRDLYENEYIRTSSLYFKSQPSFSEILNKISEYLDVL